MPLRAPLSRHLDLYRYWLSKSGSGKMPARSDINPADIPALLPYLCIVHKVDSQFRYRLVGTAAVEQFGRDLTGSLAISQVGSIPETIAAAQALAERVFANPQPIFTTGQFQTKLGALHHVSALVLPLSEDGTNVNMVIFTRVAGFSSNVRASRDWLKDAPSMLGDAVDIHDEADLERCCLDWERGCFPHSTNL